MKIKPLIICLILAMVAIVSFSALSAGAQTSSYSISVDIVPSNPAPNENTSIILSSYGSNLDSVVITWFVAGKKISSGVGMKSFTVKAPNAGAETAVRAVVSLPDGEVQKNIIIRPSIMVLLWQATDSYVPPFYKGKALPTADSEIKIVAMPEIKKAGGAMVSPRDLVYYWKLNYTNDVEGSGYGKNHFTYINDYLESVENVAVSASTTDGQYSSEANINISPSLPQISFYKNDTALGTMWDQALKDGHKIFGDEIIVAEPYFISPKNLQNSSLLWSWLINYNSVNNDSGFSKNWLPVKIEAGTTGTSSIRLDLENKYKLFSGVSKEMRVEF